MSGTAAAVAAGGDMADVRIYTKSWCGYCVAARRLLQTRGIAFDETDLTNDRPLRNKLEAETGQFTVPFVFVGDTFVGGFTELRAFDAQGGLDAYLPGADARD